MAASAASQRDARRRRQRSLLARRPQLLRPPAAPRALPCSAAQPRPYATSEFALIDNAPLFLIEALRSKCECLLGHHFKILPAVAAGFVL